VTVSRDRLLAALAASQRTIVSHEQLLRDGLTRRVIAHWVATGRLHIEFRGVYSVMNGSLPVLAREQAALLACGEGAFPSHRSAAFVWGMRKAAPTTVEVSVAGRYCSSLAGIEVHRVRSIDRRERRYDNGLWVSSPERAVLEVAASAPGELLDIIDEGLARRVLKRRELERVLERHRGCRGAARLAAVVGNEDAMTLTRSQRERAFLKLIRASGLPMPETNVPFGPYEADFLWRRERLVVEIDGYNFHTGPAVFRRDREKDLAFREAGLGVLRFAGDHVLHQPAMVLATVAQDLARRSAA